MCTFYKIILSPNLTRKGRTDWSARLECFECESAFLQQKRFSSRSNRFGPLHRTGIHSVQFVLDTSDLKARQPCDAWIKIRVNLMNDDLCMQIYLIINCLTNLINLLSLLIGLTHKVQRGALVEQCSIRQKIVHLLCVAYIVSLKTVDCFSKHNTSDTLKFYGSSEL